VASRHRLLGGAQAKRHRATLLRIEAVACFTRDHGCHPFRHVLRRDFRKSRRRIEISVECELPERGEGDFAQPRLARPSDRCIQQGPSKPAPLMIECHIYLVDVQHSIDPAGRQEADNAARVVGGDPKRPAAQRGAPGISRARRNIPVQADAGAAKGFGGRLLDRGQGGEIGGGGQSNER